MFSIHGLYQFFKANISAELIQLIPPTGLINDFKE